MRRFRRGLTAAIALGIAVGLGGCGSSSFDPTDLLAGLNTKKPLPGERHLVFPEGVPGVPQGVPPDLVKGYQPPAETAEVGGDSSVAAAAEEKPAAKPKRVASRPKPRKPKQTPVEPASAEPASRITVGPSRPSSEDTAQPAAAAAKEDAVWGPPPAQSATTTATGANAPWPATNPQPMTNAPWPDAPNPNKFSR